MPRLLILFLTLTSFFGCQSTPWFTGESNQIVDNRKSLPNFAAQNSLHRHVEQLARQLLSTSQVIDNLNTVAIGTILPTYSNNGQTLPQEKVLGLQIQESLMTFATQAGLHVIEYKTMPSIKITQTADKMLSRQVEELNQSISADYFLTGTYTKQENSTMVNIRLIQIPDNIVIAAATDYVPNDAMWTKTKVGQQNNRIYRNAY
jgi:TolB-like protein